MDLHYGSKADVRFSPSSDELLYQLRLLDVLIHILRVLCSFLCALMGVGAIMEECCFSDCSLMSWAAFFEGVVFDFYAPLMGGHTLRSGLTSETVEECCFSDCSLMSWAAFFEGVVFDFYAPLMGGHTLRSGLTSETMLFGRFSWG